MTVLYMVQSMGVRPCRAVFMQGRDRRLHNGEPQRCIEILYSADDQRPSTKPRWVPAELICATELEARSLWRRAREIGEPLAILTIQERAVAIARGGLS